MFPLAQRALWQSRIHKRYIESISFFCARSCEMNLRMIHLFAQKGTCVIWKANNNFPSTGSSGFENSSPQYGKWSEWIMALTSARCFCEVDIVIA